MKIVTVFDDRIDKLKYNLVSALENELRNIISSKKEAEIFEETIGILFFLEKGELCSSIILEQLKIGLDKIAKLFNDELSSPVNSSSNGFEEFYTLTKIEVEHSVFKELRFVTILFH